MWPSWSCKLAPSGRWTIFIWFLSTFVHITYCCITSYFLSDDHCYDPEHIPSCSASVWCGRRRKVREVVRICHAHLNRKGRLTSKMFVRILKVKSHGIILGNLFCQIVCFCDDLVDISDHVKCHFRKIVVLASKETLETRYRVFQVDVFSRCPGEHLSDVKRLR